jgi:hypothetical protein
MWAGKVDTHAENDLLVLWDTFNKFCTGRGIHDVWSRGILVCPDNKTKDTHTDMITHSLRRGVLCHAVTGHVGSMRVLRCVLRSSFPDDYRYILSVVELATASSGQDLKEYCIQIDEHSQGEECHDTKG